MAHEIGHLIGMYHDFLYRNNLRVTNPPREANGESCTNVNGMMDYYQVINPFIISLLSLVIQE